MIRMPQTLLLDLMTHDCLRLRALLEDGLSLLGYGFIPPGLLFGTLPGEGGQSLITHVGCGAIKVTHRSASLALTPKSE